MRRIFAAALAASALLPAAAYAQDPMAPSGQSDPVAQAVVPGSFAGFRIEGNVGWDKQQAFGNNNEKFGYGGSAGFDGNLTDRIVVGPEVNYWRPNNNRNTVYSEDGVVAKQGRDIWGAAVRIGFRATPDLLIFGKGGFAQQRQRNFYIDANGLPATSRGHVDGYQAGGGFQYAPSDRFSFVPANVYVSGQYVYSNFSNHTVDQHAMAGIGFRFK